jgi:hypothetical protein
LTAPAFFILIRRSYAQPLWGDDDYVEIVLGFGRLLLVKDAVSSQQRTSNSDRDVPLLLPVATWSEIVALAKKATYALRVKKISRRKSNACQKTPRE